MASYEIIGSIYRIGNTETIQTKSQNIFMRRSVTLIQRRFDQYTGAEFRQNFPTIEFTQHQCEELNAYKEGDGVKIRFEVQGVKFTDKNTGEERFFNSMRGFSIEPYEMRKPVENVTQQVIEDDTKEIQDNRLPF